jgi:pyruvate dehydrogenase E2 component (dihydrolipoyllysine-residue acetyltransferase)
VTTEIKLPELGENVDSGDLVKILVSVGDTISKDQGLLELETDKATIEVPSFVSGIVQQIHVKEGDKLKVGQLLFTVQEAERARASAEKPAKQEPAAPKPGATADSKEKEARAEPVKRPIPIKAPEPVEARPLQRPAEETEAGEEEVRPSPAAQEQPVSPVDRLAPAAPSIRRLARELGVDINRVKGTGPGGRIDEQDVKQHAKGIISAASRAMRASPAAREPELPDFSQWGEIERKAMSNVRRSTADHVAQAWRNVPQVTQFDQADISDLEKLRERFPEARGAGSPKITITAIALKVAASALKKFPQFAASIDMASEEIIYKKYCHIGVAVDTDRGLLVPVLRDADRKSIPQLAAELRDLSERARSKKLSLEEMAGGVFTITNLGGIGGTGFSPIVNYPEVAILGIARASLQPVGVGGFFQPRQMLPLSLSYDHRLIDGADAARFLRWIAEALEQPSLLLLES